MIHDNDIEEDEYCPIASWEDLEACNYYNDVDVADASRQQTVTVEFLETYEDILFWDSVSIFCDITKEIYSRFKDRLNEDYVRDYQYLDLLTGEDDEEGK